MSVHVRALAATLLLFKPCYCFSSEFYIPPCTSFHCFKRKIHFHICPLWPKHFLFLMWKSSVLLLCLIASNMDHFTSALAGRFLGLSPVCNDCVALRPRSPLHTVSSPVPLVSVAFFKPWTSRLNSVVLTVSPLYLITHQVWTWCYAMNLSLCARLQSFCSCS